MPTKSVWHVVTKGLTSNPMPTTSITPPWTPTRTLIQIAQLVSSSSPWDDLVRLLSANVPLLSMPVPHYMIHRLSTPLYHHHWDTRAIKSLCRVERSVSAKSSTWSKEPKVVKWLIIANTEDTRFLFWRTLEQFPSALGPLLRLRISWKCRVGGQIVTPLLTRRRSFTHHHSVHAVQPGISIQVILKAIPGWGRKRTEWTDWQHHKLHDEFHRQRKSGLKVST